MEYFNRLGGSDCRKLWLWATDLAAIGEQLHVMRTHGRIGGRLHAAGNEEKGNGLQWNFTWPGGGAFPLRGAGIHTARAELTARKGDVNSAETFWVP